MIIFLNINLLDRPIHATSRKPIVEILPYSEEQNRLHQKNNLIFFEKNITIIFLKLRIIVVPPARAARVPA